jgi:REP element-mobilizing transposase RayT
VLKGKTVQSKPKSLQVQILNKPQPQDIVLSIDIMHFTGLYFLVTVSRGIMFIMTSLLPDRKKNTIMNALWHVFNIYKNRGHCLNDVEFNNSEDTIHTVLADDEFKILQEEVEEMGVNVSIVTKNEHVPKVERQNRVIKERARCIIQTLPYSKVPRKIQIALIQYIVSWLNNIPKENQLLSPREMIMGEQILDCKAICK